LPAQISNDDNASANAARAAGSSVSEMLPHLLLTTSTRTPPLAEFPNVSFRGTPTAYDTARRPRKSAARNFRKRSPCSDFDDFPYGAELFICRPL